MKKLINVFLLITVLTVLFGCITVTAETEYAGTYKFTNTLESAVKLYFTNNGSSDIVVYNIQNKVTSFIPWEKSNGSVDIPAMSYCIINNLSSDITLPEGVVAEVSDKETLIERRSLKADSGKAYVIGNTSETTVKFGAFPQLKEKLYITPMIL